MKTSLVGGSLCLLALAFAGAAQTPEKGAPKKLPPFLAEMLKKSPDDFIKQFDKNKDGLLQKDELPPFFAKPFERFDRNGDGALNREEVAQMLETMRQFLAAQQPGFGKGFAPQPDFDALDKNADGRLTKDELKGTPWLARFAEIDTNGDGQIDRREFEAYLRKSADKK